MGGESHGGQFLGKVLISKNEQNVSRIMALFWKTFLVFIAAHFINYIYIYIYIMLNPKDWVGLDTSIENLKPVW